MAATEDTKNIELRDLGSVEINVRDEYTFAEEPPKPVVNIAQGIQEFESLRRSVSKDMEAGGAKTGPTRSSNPSDENFDLQAFFEDSARSGLAEDYKPKKVGVVFKNVTVVGESAATTSIADNLSVFRSVGKFFRPSYWTKKKDSSEVFDIIHDISGFVKDGEMLLVLGRPGAGCSTFLRTIANERDNYVNTQGDIKFGGISAKNFAKYRGEAVYVPEEDFHFPTLTVEQTIDFALKMRDPRKIFGDVNPTEMRHRIRDVLLRMFGLTKQAKTVVGDAFIRGISGGERKRFTIAEAMVSHGAVECWDCTTKGLDAASALDYASSLKLMTKTLQKSCIATFYQASESIYQLFDRVLVLEKGRCVYFGPTSEAKQYFLDMGFLCEARKSTPDFLTGICNPTERQVKPGFEDKVPSTSFALEAAWKNSAAYSKAQADIASFEKEIETSSIYGDLPTAIKNMKATGMTGRTKHYSVSKLQQLGALVTRQVQVVRGGIDEVISIYIGTIIMAIIFGSIFYKIPLTAMGGFSRGGALFMSIMFNAMIYEAEMPRIFMGRSTVSKQKTYAFYHGALYHLSKVVLDIPHITIQTGLYSAIAYFMFGFDAEPGKFFLFWVILIGNTLAFSEYVKFLGNLTSSLFAGQQLLNGFTVLQILFSGYFIPVKKMPPWFKWIIWINPYSYAYKALFSNEMEGIVFDCSVAGAVPAGDSYNDLNYKTCILPGSAEGSDQVRGEDYLEIGYGVDTSQIAINTIAIFLFWMLYVVLNMALVEFVDHAKGGFIRKVYKGGNAPKLNDESSELEQQKVVAQAQENIGSHLVLTGGVFSWSKMNYTVPIKGGKRLLLDDVGGWIKPGQMTALMGASGAGKTTLLDVLAQRKTAGKVEGTILLNGCPIRADFERITGYVEQMDVHDPYLTVREALQFSAILRQEPDVPKSEKFDYVERVLEMMEMNHMGDALIGSLGDGVGISVEERKRLTIGMELVAKPQILFLDEPTSGLDAQSAYNIIKFIKKLSAAGMPLVCTIHQPSSVLFEHFDRLLLLAKGGKTVYFGDIGKNSQTMINYFTRNGVRSCTQEENPAEYLLEAIGAGVGGHSDIDWVEVWKNSPEYSSVQAELTRIQAERTDPKGPAREFATGYGTQTWELFKRLNLVWWRNPQYNVSRTIQSIIVGLGLGFSFYQLGNSSTDFTQRILASFMFLMLSMLLMFSAQPIFFNQRDLFRRDYASKFYSWAPFSVCMILVELPYLAFLSTACVLCAYWTVGLDNTAMNGFFFWINFVLFVFFSISFSQMISAIMPTLMVAANILPFFANFMILFAGVVVSPAAMPKFWKSWMYWIDPFHYWMEAQLTVVLHDMEVECDDDDWFVFNAPPGQTCGNYTQAFFEGGATGYLRDDSATVCEYCQYKTGNEFYEMYDWSYDSRWRNFGILAGFWIFNIIVSCLMIYLTRKPKR